LTTIAMRLEGGAGERAPVLSTTIRLEAHTTATVVGMGEQAANRECPISGVTDHGG
jgi:hypothetical protein